ncbi:defensin-like protein 6 [Nicotiana attenuata]|uniref:Defensin-like protein 6 n=1 Tax=Nicotiana attenuata TaxID=49451 RepID=A0A1J6J1T0_NICAT|nr:defensin-like protein 6 [Nicotiana attenuata]
MERKTYGLLFCLLILFASQMAIPRVEGRVCISQSHKYKGPCLGDHNCAEVCRGEGFTGGDCIGWQRKCFCTRSC